MVFYLLIYLLMSRRLIMRSPGCGVHVFLCWCVCHCLQVSEGVVCMCFCVGVCVCVCEWVCVFVCVQSICAKVVRISICIFWFLFVCVRATGKSSHTSSRVDGRLEWSRSVTRRAHRPPERPSVETKVREATSPGMSGDPLASHSFRVSVCVFITAVPITKLFACVGGETMEDMSSD